MEGRPVWQASGYSARSLAGGRGEGRERRGRLSGQKADGRKLKRLGTRYNTDDQPLQPEKRRAAERTLWRAVCRNAEHPASYGCGGCAGGGPIRGMRLELSMSDTMRHGPPAPRRSVSTNLPMSPGASPYANAPMM
jgi:hypothetical protein